MTTNTEGAVTDVAANLTKEQRAILVAAPVGGDWFPVCWEGWKGFFRTLQKLGLAYPREPGLQALSPLGLAVRNHLTEQGVTAS